MHTNEYKVVTFRLPETLAERLKLAAAADGRTMSSYIRRVLEVAVSQPAREPAADSLVLDESAMFDD